MEDQGTQDSRELTEATVSGLRWVGVARVLIELALVGSMVVLARLIPPAAFGLFALVVIVQELATTPLEGVGSALVQRKELRRDHLQGGLLLSLGIGAALTAITLLVAVVVVVPVYGEQAAQLIAMSTPWFIVCAIYALPVAVLRRRLDFRRLSLIDLATSAVRALASIALAVFAGLDASALVLGSLAGIVVGLALALVYAPVPWPRWRPQAIREILPYGGPAALAVMCWTGFRNADYAIVGARLGAAQAGFYWRAFQLGVEYQRKIATVMTQIAFPVLSRTVDLDELFALRHRMVRLLTVVLFPLLALLVILAPVLVPWLFGPTWEPAVVPTQILAGAGAATVVIDAVGSTLMAAGRSRALLGYGIAHFVVYAGAIYVVAPRGLAAVSAAAVVVHGVFVVVAYEVMLRGRPQGTLRYLWGDIGPATVGSIALVAVALPAQLALDDAGLPVLLDMLAVALVGAVTYLAALRVGSAGAWLDLVTAMRRVLPERLQITVRLRRRAAARHEKSVAT